jgi:hypothetical protein
MRNGRCSSDESYDDRLKPLYGYIRENWHKDKDIEREYQKRSYHNGKIDVGEVLFRLQFV